MSRYKEPSALAITVKSLVLAGLLGILLMFMLYTISFVAEETGYANDKAWLNDRCNKYYYEKQYGELYDYLALYDLYADEDFAIYWEMVEGYLDYRQYEMWAAVPEGEMKEKETKMAEYRQKIQDNVINCQFDMNRTQLEAYANMCK